MRHIYKYDHICVIYSSDHIYVIYSSDHVFYTYIILIISTSHQSSKVHLHYSLTADKVSLI